MTVRLRELESWDVFGRAVEVGLSHADIEEWTRNWAPPHRGEPAYHPEENYHINPAVRDLLANVGVAYDEILGRHTEEFPLAIIQAPPGPESKITYSEVMSTGTGSAWSFRLAGVGVEADQELCVESTTSFYSTDAKIKMACVPLRLVRRMAKFVWRRRVLRKFVSSRLEVSPSDDVRIRDATVDDLDRWSDDQNRGVIQKTPELDLSGARSGHIVTYKRKFEAKGTYETGFKYEGAGNAVETTVNVEAAHSVEVAIEVPEGASYTCRIRIGCPHLAIGTTRHR